MNASRDLMGLDASAICSARLTALRAQDVTICWTVDGRDERPVQGWSENLLFEADGLGSRLPILGPSGCGKTSLLYVLAGLKRPAAGQVRYEFALKDGTAADLDLTADQPAGQWARRARFLRRHCLGYLDQDAHLLPYLRIRENLEVVPRLLGGWQPEHQDKSDDLLRRLFPGDEGPKSEDFPGILSGGQRRRAAMVPLMLEPPRVLFADEPTASLDPVLSRALLKQLRKLQKQTRCVFVWVTHDRAGLRDLAKQALVFTGGAAPELVQTADLTAEDGGGTCA